MDKQQSEPTREFFPLTDWSLVLRASGRRDGSVERALDSLCTRYWHPLYAFIRAQGKPKEDAEDIVQGFFAKLLRNENFKTTDPARGKLRSFLLSSLRKYLIDDLHKATAAKRGFGISPIELEAAEARLPSDPKRDPEEQYEHSWGLSVLAAVHAGLSKEYADKGQAKTFEVLGDFVTPDGSELPYAKLAEQLGTAVGTIKVRVFRLRNRYRERLREEIASGLDDPSQVDDELRHLHSVLSR